MTDGGKFTKSIMPDKKITFEQFCDPAFRRAELISTRDGAVWTAFLELNGIINKSQLAQQYFCKSQGWLSQKLHGCTVCDRKREFTEEEYHQLADAFRDIAHRLMRHADEIAAGR